MDTISSTSRANDMAVFEHIIQSISNHIRKKFPKWMMCAERKGLVEYSKCGDETSFVKIYIEQYGRQYSKVFVSTPIINTNIQYKAAFGFNDTELDTTIQQRVHDYIVQHLTMCDESE